VKITIVTGFFLPVPPVQGGSTEKIWFRLAQEFAAAGHDITFISRAWPGFATAETSQGIRHVRLRGADHSRFLLFNLLHDFWWGLRVARRLPAADVVICNTVTLPAWLRRLKPSAGRVVAVLARMPKGHGRAYGNVDLLFSLSAAVTAKLRAENPGLAARISPFPYPIDWALHARSAAKSSPPTPLRIGYVGRIHPEKGLRLLIAAAARLAERTDLPPWRLELVGPVSVAQGGGGAAWRDALVREFGPALGERLTFLPAEFDATRLAALYGAMDVFCYPSLAEEGETFGVAVAEAMAAGCVAVVSALPCFDQLVRDGETGVVFDHRAPGADLRLAEALTTLLSDSGLRRALATRGQEQVRRFDYQASAQSVLSVLATLVDK
jgi:glycosyltransferase involved in cell wall biosynthesis